jgi:hypothetical protein
MIIRWGSFNGDAYNRPPAEYHPESPNSARPAARADVARRPTLKRRACFACDNIETCRKSDIDNAIKFACATPFSPPVNFEP